MAMKTDQIKLPVSVATEIVNKAKDTSTIASLSPSTPQIFSDADYLVFNGKSEAEVVAEGAVKSSYEQTVDSVVAKRFKVQTTTRVTSELQWADEDNQLQIIRSIQADQAAALGRALRNRQRPTGQDPDEGARVHGRFQPHQMGHGPRSDQRDHRLRRSGPDRRGPEGP